MASYLTFEEWTGFGLNYEMNETTFQNLEKRAEIVLDIETRYFYQHNDLEADNVTRRLAFKRAMALTIEQMDKTGITSEVDKLTLSSLSIGQTSFSLGNKGQSALTIVPLEAFHLLSSVGLTYKGARYV